MNWKNWPYWLRGGVIGGGVTLVFIALFYTCVWTTTPGGFICLPLLFVSPILPFAILFDELNPTLQYQLPFILVPIVSIVSWFIASSFIGFLVGHIKSKK
ncbi:MAG: hypothetical protein UY03_C0002G0019 [Parcubacteria group bacterium GW2011_GWA2_47_64]|nr:MAG: hypothetical protein UY03_C0002G0019 [Parcubacteria group bacterium GW2011_GWA2_47_64]KKU96735.1 MAG: hypothetical protein UY29_C0007G0021 [Parcubacteria group bacterium GW2011_GWC2_48_17]